MSEATDDGDDGKPAVGDEEGDDDKPEVGDSDDVSEATATGDNEADASLIKLGQGAHDIIFSPVHVSLTYHVEKSVSERCRSFCCVSSRLSVASGLHCHHCHD